MVWSGDPDNDGDTEIVAACSESLAAYILSYDGDDLIVLKDSLYIPSENGECIYLERTGDISNCSIYEYRLNKCRNYPLPTPGGLIIRHPDCKISDEILESAIEGILD